jgi:hypothetical protein
MKMAGKHETVKDAQKWVEQNIAGVRKANYRNMPIHLVNAINKELLSLQKKYGQLGGIEAIEVVPKSTNFLGRMKNGVVLQIREDVTNAMFKRRVLSGIDPYKPHLGGLIDHEIGHALTPAIFRFEKTSSGKWVSHKTAFGKRLDSFFRKHRTKIRKEISEYAGTARHEFVAEAFAMREAKKAPQWVLNWLESEGI